MEGDSVLPGQTFVLGPKAELFEVEEFDSGESGVEPDDLEEMLQARLPAMGNTNKATYLSFRGCGFSVRESCKLADVSQATVNKWRREDEEFAALEGPRLSLLQQSLSRDILRMEFMRNLRLALRRDFRLMYKAAFAFNALSDR